MRRHGKAPCSASPRLVSQRRTGLRAKLNHVQLGRQRAARKRLLRKADHRAAALRPRRLPQESHYFQGIFVVEIFA